MVQGECAVDRAFILSKNMHDTLLRLRGQAELPRTGARELTGRSQLFYSIDRALSSPGRESLESMGFAEVSSDLLAFAGRLAGCV